MADVVTPSLMLKKRQQIINSSRVMFLWVAGASVIVSFAIVVGIFLWKQGAFNEKLLSEKGQSVSVLKQDIEAAKELNKNINNLRSDASLSNLRVAGSTNNLDVILDAMPYEGDVVSLGSSLETALLNQISVDSLSVSQDGTSNSEADATTSSSVTNAQTIPFSFKVLGSEDELKQLFKRLNQSIRPIKITNLSVASASEGRIEVDVQAITYYQDKKTFELTNKAIKP